MRGEAGEGSKRASDRYEGRVVRRKRRGEGDGEYEDSQSIAPPHHDPRPSTGVGIPAWTLMSVALTRLETPPHGARVFPPRAPSVA